MNGYKCFYSNLDLDTKKYIYRDFLRTSGLSSIFLSYTLPDVIGEKIGWNPLNFFSKSQFNMVYNMLGGRLVSWQFKYIINKIKKKISQDINYIYKIIPCEYNSDLYWDIIFKLRRYGVIPLPEVCYVMSGIPPFENINSKWKFKTAFSSYQEVRDMKFANYFIYNKDMFDPKKMERAKKLNVPTYTYEEFFTHLRKISFRPIKRI